MRAIIIAAAVIAALGLSIVLAAPQVTLSGAYFHNPDYDAVSYEIDGNRAGRDLAVVHDCFDGATQISHQVNRVYWYGSGYKTAQVTFGVYEPVTHCTGVVVDLDNGNSVESNTVTVTP